MRRMNVSVLEYKEFFISKIGIDDIKKIFIDKIGDILTGYNIYKDKMQVGLSINSTPLQEYLFNNAFSLFLKDTIDYFSPMDFVNSILPVFANSIMKQFSFTGSIRITMKEDFINTLTNFWLSNLLHSIYIDLQHKGSKYKVIILLLSKKIMKNLVIKEYFYDKNIINKYEDDKKIH